MALERLLGGSQEDDRCGHGSQRSQLRHPVESTQAHNPDVSAGSIFLFDASIRDLYICSGQLLTFDWRRALDLVFSPLHYAQKKNTYRHKIEDDAEKDLVKRFGRKTAVMWTEREVRVSKYGGGKLQEQIVDGYVARMSHSHAKAGRPFRINEYEDDNGYPVSYKRAIEDHMDGFRNLDYLQPRVLESETSRTMLIDCSCIATALYNTIAFRDPIEHPYGCLQFVLAIVWSHSARRAAHPFRSKSWQHHHRQESSPAEHHQVTRC